MIAFQLFGIFSEIQKVEKILNNVLLEHLIENLFFKSKRRIPFLVL